MTDRMGSTHSTDGGRRTMSDRDDDSDDNFGRAITVGEQLARQGNTFSDVPVGSQGAKILPVRYPMPGGAGRSSAAYPPKPEDPNSVD